MITVTRHAFVNDPVSLIEFKQNAFVLSDLGDYYMNDHIGVVVKAVDDSVEQKSIIQMLRKNINV